MNRKLSLYWLPIIQCCVFFLDFEVNLLWLDLFSNSRTTATLLRACLKVIANIFQSFVTVRKMMILTISVSEENQVLLLQIPIVLMRMENTFSIPARWKRLKSIFTTHNTTLAIHPSIRPKAQTCFSPVTSSSLSGEIPSHFQFTWDIRVSWVCPGVSPSRTSP